MNNRKLLVIGIDGMDPRLTKRLLDEGRLPNIRKMIQKGSAREDLVLLGANPTITPPMWTTLATGAYPSTHGITCFWNQHPTDLSRFAYAVDSGQCLAEQIWNCTAEAGKKTLVWTWPGSSWPPSSSNENLHVVDGTGPMGANGAAANIDEEVITYASVQTESVKKRTAVDMHGGAGCVIDGEAVETEDEKGNWTTTFASAENIAWPLLDHMEGEEGGEFPSAIISFDSPLRSPKNWKHEVAETALEFYTVIQDGYKQLPSLLLKNEDGIFDRVEIYMSKKDAEPWVALKDGEYLPAEPIEITLESGDKIQGTRSVSILKIEQENPAVIMSLGVCLDITTGRKDALWHPKSLYQQAVDIAGYVPTVFAVGGGYPEMVSRRTLPAYDNLKDWQSKVIRELIKANGYEAVFTHLHSCDHVGHSCWRWAKTREKYGYNDEKVYQSLLEEVYLQADAYVGSFLPLIAEGWTLIVTSDHGLLCSEEDELPFLGEAFVINTGVMSELGYTVMKKGSDGKTLHKIDWEKTRAVASRGGHIYINLKGRNIQDGIEGIVDPADKYELERQIIDDLYNYRLNGKRIVSLVIRNKEAALLGLSGERSGDIIYFIEEGFNRLHGDALSTTYGYFDTSVSPIFIAAGPGIKEGFTMTHQIRQVDVAPTVASVLGVRQPKDADGTPCYQILSDYGK